MFFSLGKRPVLLLRRAFLTAFKLQWWRARCSRAWQLRLNRCFVCPAQDGPQPLNFPSFCAQVGEFPHIPRTNTDPRPKIIC